MHADKQTHFTRNGVQHSRAEPKGEEVSPYQYLCFGLPNRSGESACLQKSRAWMERCVFVFRLIEVVFKSSSSEAYALVFRVIIGNKSVRDSRSRDKPAGTRRRLPPPSPFIVLRD
ncbi:hypothetical protein ACLOJK_012194 [Asimina triloba]